MGYNKHMIRLYVCVSENAVYSQSIKFFWEAFMGNLMIIENDD